jgi:hypothetical protein
VLPDGGLGNLIAAPLQGRRKADGLTVFLDPATLEPHENQWLFLATLDRLSPGDAQRVARQAKTDAGRQRGRAMSRSEYPGAPTAAPVVRGLAAGCASTCDYLAALPTFKHAHP